MKRNSRWPGFYKLSVEDRRKVAAEALGMDVRELAAALADGGLRCEKADKVIENVLGTFALPFAVTLNVQVNGQDVNEQSSFRSELPPVRFRELLPGAVEAWNEPRPDEGAQIPSLRDARTELVRIV